MSDIENKKVQDILREVADISYRLGIDSDMIISDLCTALGITFYGTGPALQRALREIAGRIDRQSVVEVQVPPQKTDHDGATTELEALPMPAVIDVHDCIIEVHVYGSADDQD